MPKWNVHVELGKYCSIDEYIMEEINKFLDEGFEHDKGRLIIYGHWELSELLPVASYAYEKWGSVGVKALIHHHLMDYTCSLMTKLKYGALIKHIVNDINKMGFSIIYEDVDTGQIYTNPNVRGTLRTMYLKKDEVKEFITKKIVLPFITEALNTLIKGISSKTSEKPSKCREDVLKSLSSSIRELENCIITSAIVLVDKYVGALLNKDHENPCKAAVQY